MTRRAIAAIGTALAALALRLSHGAEEARSLLVPVAAHEAPLLHQQQSEAADSIIGGAKSAYDAGGNTGAD